VGECAKHGIERALVCEDSVKKKAEFELIEAVKLGAALIAGLEPKHDLETGI
jgi:hypothetical protein